MSALLKKTRLQLAPEQQQMIDGVSVRLQNYRDGIERVTALIARRAELVALVRELASYVQVECKGDLEVLVSSGFPIQKPVRNPIGELPVPGLFSI